MRSEPEEIESAALTFRDVVLPANHLFGTLA
jgi:hypothetical protein